MKAVTCALNKRGGLICARAGTNGRLGILDTMKCLPTFSTADEVVGIMTGGEKAFVHAQGGVEDSKGEDRKNLEHLKVGKQDVMVALSASRRAPCCIDALGCTRGAGTRYIGLSCDRPAELTDYSDIVIEVNTGPEILTGPIRLKAGTVEKMILSMISTAAMVGIGKVYKNLMVDMRATNLKLVERAKRIMSMACGCTGETTQAALELADGGIKAAIVMILTGITAKEAKGRLETHKGFVRRCLDGTYGHD